LAKLNNIFYTMESSTMYIPHSPHQLGKLLLTSSAIKTQ